MVFSAHEILYAITLPHFVAKISEWYDDPLVSCKHFIDFFLIIFFFFDVAYFPYFFWVHYFSIIKFNLHGKNFNFNLRLKR